NDLRGVVGHHDRIADVLDNEVQPVTVLPHDLFCIAQLLQVGTHLLVSAPQIGDVAHHRHHSGANTLFAVGGGANRFEKNFFAFHNVDQCEVARGVGCTHCHR